jgi:hypothetical protein
MKETSMFFERWIKWITPEASSRAGLLSVPTALVVDASRPTAAPAAICLADWLLRERAKTTPPRAMGFLQIDRDRTMATVVDLTRRTIAARIRFETRSLGEFSEEFLMANDTDEDGPRARSLLPAPRWLVSHPPHRALATEKPPAPPPAPPGGGIPGGIVPDEERPPRPGIAQALVALAEETSNLQSLPVVSNAPLDA